MNFTETLKFKAAKISYKVYEVSEQNTKAEYEAYYVLFSINMATHE